MACLAHDRPGAAAAGEWARAAAGGVTVVGARAGAWAPVPELGRVVVLDEHDERYQAEQAPDLARPRRGRRAGRAGRRAVPAGVAVPDASRRSPGATWSRPSRADERRGWPAVEVVDRRHDDPTKGGLFSERFVDLLRRPGRVVCVREPHRPGPAAGLRDVRRRWAAARCAAPSVEQLEVGRPPLPPLRHRAAGRLHRAAASTRFRNLRVGVTRAREELEALVRRAGGAR